MSRRRQGATVFVCLMFVASPRAEAQIQPAGSEFRANTHTADAQLAPAVCRTSAGGTVVVWESDNQDGRGWGIFAQRYDTDERAVGSEFQVNTSATGNQRHPDVACDAAGNFLVVWDSDQIGRIRGVFARRYDRSGQPLGEEFQVNDDPAADSMLPAACSDADGDLVVAWQGYQLTGALDILARRYSNTGEPQGTQFQVNTYTTGAQAHSALACTADGEFVVVWDSDGQDGDDSGILGQRYDSAGTPQGFEFQVNSHSRGAQRHPRIAAAADGAFVVGWQTEPDGGHGYAVAAQRFDRDGTALGSELRVGRASGDRQYRPDVAAGARGDFVVVWSGDGQDGSGDAVSGQRYDHSGTALGTEFQINAHTTGNQRQPVVGADAAGDFVVVWQSSGQDSSNDGVFGRRFTVCGNGVVDPGEDCDDGSTVGGDCCSADCQFEMIRSLWGGERMSRDVSSEGLLSPRLDETNSVPCSDANACTVGDFCLRGVCAGGAPPDCDDDNVCTTDSCKPSTGCVHAANTAACDDGNACTLNDTCHKGACTGGQPLDCDDGNPCTDDSCDPATGCAHSPNTAACDDGNACTAGDTCQAGVCVGGPPPTCDDDNACTDDACDPMMGCLNLASKAPCDDADPCTTADACVAGICFRGSLAACDDGNPCTDDSCASVIGCLYTRNTSPCDDGNACTRADTCVNGTCAGTEPVVCTASDQCHLAGVCDPATGQCSTPPRADGTSCDDGDRCTVDDRCRGGVCGGTDGVPFLVKDARRDGGSYPAELTSAGGKLFFRANDGKSGRELWVSDGTPEGTRLVDDIAPGRAGSSPGALTNVNGVVFFSAADATNGREPWRSDGTAEGTGIVKDIHPAGSSNPRHLTAVNGTLFFVAEDDTSGAELWRSDGTDGATFLVKDIRPGRCGTVACSSAPDHLVHSNGTLFFTASDGTNGVELWRSDGTEAGTVMVKDIQPGSGDSLPAFLTDLGGTLLFRAFADGIGYELWRSDGTEAGTTLVKDLRLGRCGRQPCSSSPSYLASAGDRVFFGASREHPELWESDGTAAGTVRIGTLPGLPEARASLDGTLLFRTSGPAGGSQLWRSDGTQGGTRRVAADNHAGAAPADPAWFATVDGTLYFSAADARTGTELWRSDGTATGTMLVSDIYPGSTESSPNSSFPASLTAVDGTLFFSADDGERGRELWALCGERSIADSR